MMIGLPKWNKLKMKIIIKKEGEREGEGELFGSGGWKKL